MIDTEAVIVGFLRADPPVLNAIGGDRIYTSLPSHVEFPCVRVSQLGGMEDVAVYQITQPFREIVSVQIEVWGGRRATAANIANVIRARLAMELPGKVEGGNVAGVHLPSVGSLPDDSMPTGNGRARQRYIIVGDLTVKHDPLP